MAKAWWKPSSSSTCPWSKATAIRIGSTTLQLTEPFWFRSVIWCACVLVDTAWTWLDPAFRNFLCDSGVHFGQFWAISDSFQITRGSGLVAGPDGPEIRLFARVQCSVFSMILKISTLDICRAACRAWTQRGFDRVYLARSSASKFSVTQALISSSFERFPTLSRSRTDQAWSRAPFSRTKGFLPQYSAASFRLLRKYRQSR